MNKSKIYMIVGICILCVSLIGTTLAYYTKTLFSTEVSTITHGLDYYINYEKGQTVSTNTLNPSDNYTGGAYSSVELWKTDDTYDIYGHIYLDITSMSEDLSDSEAVKYTIVNNNTVIAEGTVKNNSENTILMKSDIPLETTKQLYTVYIWLDKNGNLDTSLESSTLSLSVRCEATMKKINTLVEHLTNKYMSANPTKATVANNGINYYYAPSVNMMNDGMGSNHTWEDGANAGNIRYYGKNPKNYIDIGDRDASGNVIPWRIIGVFKNMTLADGSKDTLVKVIRDEPLSSTMQWDDDSNDWHNASLQTYLNSGEYYTGLSQDVKNKIAKVEWNLGGLNGSVIERLYHNTVYEKERGNEKCSSCTYNTIWEGDIALMYPSDYGYAADLTKCSKDLYYYDEDTTNCTGTDWLFNSSYQWLLNPSSSGYSYVWLVSSGGYVSFSILNSSFGVSPVLYLDPELSIESGDGSTIASAYVVQ